MINLALVGEQRSRIRDLSGFRTSHRVPKEHSERTRAFVRRIAADDIGRDLDQRFSDLRRQMQLKRTQLDVSEPKEGRGEITTPEFQYRVTVELCEQDPTTLVWRRSVSDFHTTVSVLSEQFAAAFGTVFDTVVFTPPDPVDVEAFIDWMEEHPDNQLKPEYDRTGTWCRLTASQPQAAEMLVEHRQISLRSLTSCSPDALLSSFLAFRDLLPGIAWTT